MIINKRKARIIFIEYIFSNNFTKTKMEDVTHNMLSDNQMLEYNDKLLIKLKEIYLNKYETIINLLSTYNKKSDLVDFFEISVLISAITEMFYNEKKIVISEYLKIGDIFNLNTVFINGILNAISNDEIIIKKQEEIRIKLGK